MVQEHLEGSLDEGTPTEYERSFVSLLIYYRFKLQVIARVTNVTRIDIKGLKTKVR